MLAQHMVAAGHSGSGDPTGQRHALRDEAVASASIEGCEGADRLYHGTYHAKVSAVTS